MAGAGEAFPSLMSGPGPGGPPQLGGRPTSPVRGASVGVSPVVSAAASGAPPSPGLASLGLASASRGLGSATVPAGQEEPSLKSEMEILREELKLQARALNEVHRVHMSTSTRVNQLDGLFDQFSKQADEKDEIVRKELAKFGGKITSAYHAGTSPPPELAPEEVSSMRGQLERVNGDLAELQARVDQMMAGDSARAGKLATDIIVLQRELADFKASGGGTTSAALPQGPRLLLGETTAQDPVARTEADVRLLRTQLTSLAQEVANSKDERAMELAGVLNRAEALAAASSSLTNEFATTTGRLSGELTMARAEISQALAGANEGLLLGDRIMSELRTERQTRRSEIESLRAEVLQKDPAPAEASMKLHFPTASLRLVDPADFERELRSSLVLHCGAKQSSVDSVTIELRDGSIMAAVKGVSQVISELKALPLNLLMVQGHRPQANLDPTPTLPLKELPVDAGDKASEPWGLGSVRSTTRDTPFPAAGVTPNLGLAPTLPFVTSISSAGSAGVPPDSGGASSSTGVAPASAASASSKMRDTRFAASPDIIQASPLEWETALAKVTPPQAPGEPCGLASPSAASRSLSAPPAERHTPKEVLVEPSIDGVPPQRARSVAVEPAPPTVGERQAVSSGAAVRARSPDIAVNVEQVMPPSSPLVSVSRTQVGSAVAHLPVQGVSSRPSSVAVQAAQGVASSALAMAAMSSPTQPISRGIGREASASSISDQALQVTVPLASISMVVPQASAQATPQSTPQQTTKRPQEEALQPRPWVSTGQSHPAGGSLGVSSFRAPAPAAPNFLGSAAVAPRRPAPEPSRSPVRARPDQSPLRMPPPPCAAAFGVATMSTPQQAHRPMMALPFAAGSSVAHSPRSFSPIAAASRQVSSVDMPLVYKDAVYATQAQMLAAATTRPRQQHNVNTLL